MSSGRLLVLELGLSFLLILAPLLFGSVHPWAFLGISAVIFLLLFLFPESWESLRFYPKNSRVVALGLFLWIAIQSPFFSLNRYEATTEMLQWIAWGGAAFFLGPSLPRRSILRILILIALLGALEAAYGFWQSASGQEFVLWRRKESYLGFLTGTYFNRNHAAGFFELCLGVSLGLCFYFLKKKNFMGLTIFGLVSLETAAALFNTGSRLGTLSFLAAATAVAVIKKRSLGFCFLMGGVILLAIAWRTGLLSNYFQRWTDFDNLSQSGMGRLHVWRDAFPAIKDHPLGVGLGNFKWAFPAYQSAQSMKGWFHLHQDYGELVLCLGLPAAAILFYLFMELGRKMVQRTMENFHDELWLVRGCLIALISLAIHGLADFNFAIPANSLLFLTIFGMGWRLSLPEGESVS